VDDLVTWLLEQVAEDERVAREAIQETTGRWTVRSTDWGGGRLYVEDDCGAMILHARYPNDPQYPHIARWDPAGVLAECEAKRRRIEHLTSAIADWRAGRHDSQDRETAIEDFSTALKLEAFAYAGRPGYREDWKP
jgi:hypothetical protein